MKYEKYYNLIEEQSKIYDKTQNCQIGQTWKYHLLPVIKNACMLAEKYGADKDIVEVAAIFHDYADLLDFANRENHHILGAELAEGVLIQDGFSQEFVNKVKLCIKNHRASVVNQKFSKEEICVADADAMSHLDSVVELICWRAYLNEDISACNDFVKTKIQKSYAKMSNDTKLLMKDKYDSIMKVLLWLSNYTIGLFNIIQKLNINNLFRLNVIKKMIYGGLKQLFFKEVIYVKN